MTLPKLLLTIASSLSLHMGVANAASSGFSYTATIYDTTGQSKATRNQILSNLGGAIAQWTKTLVMRGNLRIRVDIVSEPGLTVDCASTTNTFVGYSNGLPVYEEGASYTIRTGVHLVSSSQPDLLIRINPQYLKTDAWFDPRPTMRIDPVPTNKIDFVSILTHELAHGFGFNGFVNQATGELNPSVLSRFDAYITRDLNGLYFSGPAAMQVYGGPIPLTNNDFYHYGNVDTPQLLTGLMNGVWFYYGTRYYVSPLDLAMMKDLGQVVR